VPELAEVEYFRRQWNSGIGKRINRVSVHTQKRIFRGADVGKMQRVLEGSVLLYSEARGKRMIFRFSTNAWLGLHLGMTGSLRVEAADFLPAKHDHLVLYQPNQVLVFSDPRQFGRVQFHKGEDPPVWWSKLAPSLDSPEFTAETMEGFLKRHSRLAIKAALLLQDGFPGVGNWMADEILWRSRLNPRGRASAIRGQRLKTLWKMIRWVSRGAMKHMSRNFSDPPRGWLFNERWKRGGVCPIHRTLLEREIVGGRTTAWCRRCQK